MLSFLRLAVFKDAAKVRKAGILGFRGRKTQLFDLNFVFVTKSGLFRSYRHSFWLVYRLYRWHTWQKDQIFYYLQAITPEIHVICKGSIERVTKEGLIYAGITHKQVFPDMESALIFKKQIEALISRS